MKIAICDDEKNMALYNKELVEEWAQEQGLSVFIRLFNDAESLLASNSFKFFDILLLDIEMGENNLNGIELAKLIRQNNSELAIIFITGYLDFMQQGYDVSALHYLIKPINKAKLFEVLSKFINKPKDTFLTLNINRENILIPLRNIVYIESSLHYVEVHTYDELFRAKISLFKIAEMLDESFFKCTRSYIVNLRHIRRISKAEVLLANGFTVPLGRGLYNDINKAFIKYV